MKDVFIPEDYEDYSEVTHCSILAWEIPWTEKPDGTVHGVTKSWTQLSDQTTRR